MTDNLFPLMYWAIGGGVAAGTWPVPSGERVTGGSPRYNLYPAADGRIMAAAPLEDRFWVRFCELIGLNASRLDDVDDPEGVIALVRERIAARTSDEWRAVFEGQDVCCNVVNSLEEALADPHFRGRGLFDRSIRLDGQSMPATPSPIVPDLRSPGGRAGAADPRRRPSLRIVIAGRLTVADTTLRYGLLLPHFGAYTSREVLLRAARAAERYGFDSIWARDHLVWHPHKLEGQDPTYVDLFVTLALAAGVTERIILGSASLIPHRHPINAALALAGLEFMAGPGRLIAGFGIGTYNHEFEAAGMAHIDRRELIEEQVAIMRRLWTGERVSYSGQFYSFEDVDIHPTPSAADAIPIWYCGNSPASVRRAVEYCQGWMPGRMPIRTYAKRIERLRQRTEEAGQAVDRRRDPDHQPGPHDGGGPGEGELAGDAANRRQGLDPARVRSLGAGRRPRGRPDRRPPDTIVEITRRYQRAGLQHTVYDLRFRFDDWEECVAILGEEVLPQLRRGDQ